MDFRLAGIPRICKVQCGDMREAAAFYFIGIAVHFFVRGGGWQGIDEGGFLWSGERKKSG